MSWTFQVFCWAQCRQYKSQSKHVFDRRIDLKVYNRGNGNVSLVGSIGWFIAVVLCCVCVFALLILMRMNPPNPIDVTWLDLDEIVRPCNKKIVICRLSHTLHNPGHVGLAKKHICFSVELLYMWIFRVCFHLKSSYIFLGPEQKVPTYQNWTYYVRVWKFVEGEGESGRLH